MVDKELFELGERRGNDRQVLMSPRKLPSDPTVSIEAEPIANRDLYRSAF